jgi:hypothetical protein
LLHSFPLSLFSSIAFFSKVFVCSQKMADDDAKAGDLIPGSLKRSKSYHEEYAGKTYAEIKQLAVAKPPDPKARQMKKLIEQAERLREKARRRPR